jgi:hypothetical protein
MPVERATLIIWLSFIRAKALSLEHSPLAKTMLDVKKHTMMKNLLKLATNSPIVLQVL